MNLKQTAGERAAEYVKDGMTIGLGTGSTVYWTIQRLAARVKDGLEIRAIATSKQTENLAIRFGIPLTSFAKARGLDLTIDGADEISPHLDLIKGGGGALMREKLVAAASRHLIIVADESKLRSHLSSFPLPVEIVSFGWETAARRVENLGFAARLRLNEDEPFVTDNGNYILDCACGRIENPAKLHGELKMLTGIVETGLFVGMASTAVIAGANGIKIIEKDLENL